MKKTSTNSGNNHLEEAMALLINNQAAFIKQLADSERKTAKLRRETDERFRRIEAILLDHSRILAEHTRLLQALPETIREKIGFKGRQ